MPERFDYRALAPAGYRAMLALETAVRESGLDRTLLELMKIRASQLNGCAYCIDMHTIDARARGETEQRIYLLDAWRESRLYSERERAALAWTEAVTLVADGHVPDAAYDEVRARFSEAEVAALTFAIVAINGWNRLAIASRAEPGHHVPRAEHATEAKV